MRYLIINLETDTIRQTGRLLRTDYEDAEAQRVILVDIADPDVPLQYLIFADGNHVWGGIPQAGCVA